MLLHFHSPTCSCKQRYNLYQKTAPLLQSISISLFHPHLFPKSSLRSPIRSPSPPSFCVQPSQLSAPKTFSLPQPFRQFRLRQRTRKLERLARNDTVLISPFFLKLWKVIAGLTVTDSLLLRLRKLVYCRCGKPSNPPSLVPSTYCRYLHTLLIPPQELILPLKPLD